MQNGKGDRARNNFTKKFRDNYDDIRWTNWAADQTVFKCPECGSRHFGRDTALVELVVKVEKTVRCHDEFKRGCKWRGYWWDGRFQPKSKY